MLTIKSLSRNFQELNTDIIIDDSFNETKSDFEKANIEQLRAGKTNEGQRIGPSYRNKAYAAKKFAMNPEPGFGTPDLILTGSFTDQINVELEGEKIYEFSNDEKAPMLEKKYKNIFGLGGSFKKDYLNESLKPVVFKKISNFIGVKF